MIDVTALGEILIDFIPARDRTGEFCLKPMVGGAPGNFAAAVQAYGCQSALIAKVGQDTFGDMLVRKFAALGVATEGIVRDASVFTTLAFVTLSPEGERSFSFARKPGADTCLRTEECEFPLISKAKAFHFGTLSLSHQPARDATRMAVICAKNSGKLITFDPNLRMPLWESAEVAAEFMHWGIKQADVVKISGEEVEFLFGCGPEEGARIIREDCHTELVFVTCGAKGCYFSAEGGSGWVAAPKVRAVDTTGAGDIFFGAAVSRILKTGKYPCALTERELREITAFACTAASLSTKHHGGIDSIPPESDVLNMM